MKNTLRATRAYAINSTIGSDWLATSYNPGDVKTK